MRSILQGALVAACVGLIVAPSTAATTTTTLDSSGALAVAQAVRTSLTVPGFLLVESVFDGGGPVSQSVLDAVGGAGFASLPYPGETAMSVPGLIAAGGGPTLPAYPLYVRATGDQPDQALSDPAGVYALRAVVSPSAVTADARLGSHGQALVSGGQTHTQVGRTAAAVTAQAESVTEGVVVAEGALSIGTVRSRSLTVLSEAGESPGAAAARQTTSELVVEGGRAGPLSFAYGPGGFVVNEGPLPIPAEAGFAALNEALAPAGVTIAVARGGDVAGGRSSDALVVEQQIPLGSGQPGVLRLRFGGTTTAVGESPMTADLGGVDETAPVPTAPPTTSDVTGEQEAARPLVAGPRFDQAQAPIFEPAQSNPASQEAVAGGEEVPVAAPADGSATGQRAVTIGVTGALADDLRITYWSLAVSAIGIVAGAWWWRRGAQRS